MEKNKETMTIGALSKISGIGIQTIRYYERKGLLKPVTRKSSGYRVFNWDSYKSLRFLKHAQELGFSLSEIKDLLRLRANKKSSCVDVQSRANKHLKGVEEKIAQLGMIREVLSELIQKCRSREVDDACPILDCFEKMEDSHGPR
ncbi:MAG: heavy metal-responsive transcriptional regulator [Bdellovibrionales bacterium CG10_big_fil_rev_8_21_14_0_10_45_34]|nr:MAG: heavy metal-responsive transcriptional regulator [Bdellovibrionales bacterium CG10_big_fil_rev_8_21_14_0_10_45_34]